MTEPLEKHPNLSVLAGFAAATGLSAVGLSFFLMLAMGSERTAAPLRMVGLWQLIWIAPLGLYAERRKRFWFSRGVWVSAVLLAMLNALIGTGQLRI